MSDVDVLVGQVMPAVGAAIGAYGVSVLNRVEDGAAEGTVSLGQRLLARILNRSADRTRIDAAVTDLAAMSDDPDALAALRLQIRKAVLGDKVLATELAALLPDRPAVRAVGARSIAVGGDVTGIVSTGDGATNVQFR